MYGLLGEIAPGLNTPEYDTNRYDCWFVLNVASDGFNFVNGPAGDVLTYTFCVSRDAYVSPMIAVIWIGWFGATATRKTPLFALPPALPHSPSRRSRASCGEFASP